MPTDNRHRASPGPSLADNTTIFYQTPASAQNGSLTLFGCEVYCVPGQPRLKSDCGNRLFQWFLPGLFLIVSIATPPIGWWYQVWTSVRPVADPFDAILSISIALLLYTIPIIAPHLGPKSILSAVLSSSCLKKPAHLPNPPHCGRLAEDRTRGVAGAWFTSLSCIAGFVLATVPPLGGSNPSGAMVAASLVLAPLTRDVLLGHSVGEVGSNHCVREVLASFLADREVLEQLHEALTHGEKEMDTVAWLRARRGINRYGRWQRSGRAGPGRIALWSNTNRRNLERLGFIVAKDMLLAVAIPVLFSMTTCGWLSSCKLWANYYGYGAARARVPLDNTAAFEWNNRVLYPALVSVSRAGVESERDRGGAVFWEGNDGSGYRATAFEFDCCSSSIGIKPKFNIKSKS
ncbi:hypothetical protein B0H13DRAFT_1919085 [Mycena leptocephala]|nr:hypothetical protein B0H13DRAFT_1919085 [Mycena leptocephala]